ncbi:MAG: CAP domain-containing protein [Acutalibacteraceae bacterium]
MSKNNIQRIIAVMSASALLIATGCSATMQKNSNKNNTNDFVLSPVTLKTEENKSTLTDKIPDDIFDDIKTVKPTKNSETVKNTDNNNETSISNSRVDIPEFVSSQPSEDKAISDDNDDEDKNISENAKPENTTANTTQTQETPSAQQETTQKTTVQQNNTPTTVKESTTTDTQNNTTNKTQTTTQNTVKPVTTTTQNNEITSISLDKSKVTLDIGETVKLNLSIYPSNVAHKAYTYSTSDNRVAGIDINGVITAKADGTAQITVTTDNGKTAQCQVTVRKPAPTAVSINPTDLKLSVNDVYTLSASNNVNSDDVKYTWSSNNTDCIKIISYNNKTVAVKAVSCGTATVTVKTQNNVTASCRITVSKTDENVKQMVNIVNDERATNGGHRDLSNRINLNELADIRAKEIAQKFSHTRPDGSSCFSILDDIHYMSAGENIAYGQTSPAEVMNSWMKSSGHRANILSSDFNCIGVGHYKSDGIDYWVQIFVGY